MNKFTFYWRNGQREVLEGTNAADAMRSAGYAGGAVGSLDFYTNGETDDFTWNRATRTWEKKSEDNATPAC